MKQTAGTATTAARESRGKIDAAIYALGEIRNDLDRVGFDTRIDVSPQGDYLLQVAIGQVECEHFPLKAIVASEDSEEYVYDRVRWRLGVMVAHLEAIVDRLKRVRASIAPDPPGTGTE